MPKAIKDIIIETMNNLKEKLVNKDLAKEKVNEIITNCITNAFKEAGSDNKIQLFRKLSMQLHPDHFSPESQELGELYIFLKTYELEGAPQQILNDYYNRPSFKTLLRNAVDNPLADGPKLNDYMKEKLNYLFSGHSERYIFPFNKAVEVISGAIDIVLAVATVGAIIVAVIPILIGSVIFFIADKFINSLLNIIANNKFNELIEEYRSKITQKTGWEESIDKLVMTWKEENPQATKQAEKLYRTSAREQKYNEIWPRGFNKVAMSLKALYNAVVRPLPESGFINILASIISRPFQIVAAPLLVITTTAVELVPFVNSALLLTIISVPMLISIASLLILNAPLYALDAVRYMAQRCSNTTDEPQGTNTENNYSSPGCSNTLMIEGLNITAANQQNQSVPQQPEVYSYPLSQKHRVGGISNVVEEEYSSYDLD